MRRRGAIAAAALPLLLLHLIVLTADFFAPYSAREQTRDLPFAAPTRVRFVTPQGELRPFVYGLRERRGRPGSYEEDPGRVYPIRFLVPGAEYSLPGGFEARLHLFGVDAPGRIFLLGSDGLGRDQLSRLLLGGRISLFAGIAAAGLSLGCGVLLGSLAGYYGGWVDAAVMRLVDVFLALPWLYLLLAVRAFLPLHIDAADTLLLLVLVIGLVDWARPARLVRGVALSARERDYVLAARGFGAGDGYLLWRHVAPQAGAAALTQAALLAPQYVLAEVTLSYLGLGVPESEGSWGALLAQLQRLEVMTGYWWMWMPALALVAVFFAYYRLADALRQRIGHVAT